jgi:hypothetical protein
MTFLTVALALSLASAPKPAQKTQLKIEVKPSSTVVFVDGKRRGTGAKPVILAVPGRHVIKLVHGRDEHQEMVAVKKGESRTWTWAFEDDRPKAPSHGGGASEEDAKAPTGETPAAPDPSNPLDDSPPAD